MKSVFQYFESSTFLRHYSKVWTVFEKYQWFYNTWKLCDFALKSGLQITRPKCPGDVVLWTRLRDCNTIRCALAIHNINILVVIWRFREITQCRIARHVDLPPKPFIIIFCPQQCVTVWNCKIQTHPSLQTIQKLSSFQCQKHYLPYLFAYKPTSAISRDPKLFYISSC